MSAPTAKMNEKTRQLINNRKSMRASAILFQPLQQPESIYNNIESGDKKVERDEVNEAVLDFFKHKSSITWLEFSRVFQEATGATNSQMDTFGETFKGGNMTEVRWRDLTTWFRPLKSRNDPEDKDGWDLEMIFDVCNQPWFHGFLDASTAANLLANKEQGTFMIRFSGSVKGAYALSVRVDDEYQVHHWRITCVKETNCYPTFVLQGEVYSSLEELVDAFRIDSEPLEISSKGDDIHLVYPLSVPPAIYLTVN